MDAIAGEPSTKIGWIGWIGVLDSAGWLAFHLFIYPAGALG